MSATDSRPGEDHIRRTHEYVDILLPALREVARRFGYALAVHGSLEWDIDLVAVPWCENAPDGLVAKKYAFKDEKEVPPITDEELANLRDST